MPKFNCPCKHIIPLGDIPNKNEYLFLSDIDYDNYKGSIDSEIFYAASKRFYECPDCQRLLVFWDNDTNKFASYKREAE